MDRYIIAVKREARNSMTGELSERVADIQGLETCGTPKPNRLMVEATAEALQEVTNRLGQVCHIEAIIEHHP